MTCLNQFKKLVLKCDVFRTTQFFRYRGEPQYTTLTGSICSIIIVITFISLFATAILDTFSKGQLDWKYGLIQQNSQEFIIHSDTSTPSKFIFAIGVGNLNLVEGDRYFDIFLTQKIQNNQLIEDINIPLEPCNRSNWEGAGQNILEIYDRLNFSNKLCPPTKQEFSIQGMLSSQNYKYISLSLKKCDRTIAGRPCASNETVHQYLNLNPNYFFNIYFLNTLINPSNPNEISFYLEDRNFVPFNLLYGGQLNLFMSHYEVITDQSIFPNTISHINQGGVVNYLGQLITTQVYSQQYATINFKKSSTSLNIQRTYQKIDTTLSYIGGLFGFILIIFMFMNVYTEYAYEIDMGDQLYDYHHKDPLNAQKFNFITFLGYLFYSFFDNCGYVFDWPFMKKFKQCRQQIQQQFDISFLMKRIIFLQRSLKILFEDHQLKGLHLHNKLTLQQAQQLRLYYKLRDKLKEEGLEQFQINSKKKDSNQSQEMNNTENILAVTENIPDESFSLQLDRIPKRHKSSDHKMFHSSLSQIESKKQFRNMSQSSLRNNQSLKNNQSLRHSKDLSNMSENYKSNNEQENSITNKIKLLKQQSKQGNLISKKIFQGFSGQIIRNILLKIEEENIEENSEQQEISIEEKEDQVQIRISKRRPTIDEGFNNLPSTKIVRVRSRREKIQEKEIKQEYTQHKQ